jgi:transposase
MPWQEKSLMDQRTQFIADYHRELFTVVELADRFNISRKTAYKWASSGISVGKDRAHRSGSRWRS